MKRCGVSSYHGTPPPDFVNTDIYWLSEESFQIWWSFTENDSTLPSLDGRPRREKLHRFKTETLLFPAFLKKLSNLVELKNER